MGEFVNSCLFDISPFLPFYHYFFWVEVALESVSTREVYVDLQAELHG